MATITVKGDNRERPERDRSPTSEHHGHSRWVLAVLLMAPLLYQADATIANVATPAIRSDLHASGAAIELVVGGYLIASAVLVITGARLGKTHGYKRLFLLGVSVFGASSLVAGLAPNAAVLVVMRVAQGAGGALMFPQVLTGIQLNFAGAQRTRAIALYAIALSAGAVLGQILGGVLVSADIAGAGWRPVLLVNVPVCAAVLAGGLRFLPEDEQRAVRHVDLVGVCALSLALLLLVVPLTLIRTAGWSQWGWWCLGASVPALWVFVKTQRRQADRRGDPLLNVDVVRRPAVLFGLLALLAATGTYYALLFTLAQYIQQGLGRGALTSGLILVPWVAAFGLAGQITRRLPARIGSHLPLGGYLLLGAAYLAIAGLLLSGRPGDATLAVPLAAGGLGLGTGFATLLGHLTNAVPDEYAPDISGVSTTAMQIGATLGVAAIGSLYFALAGPSVHSADHGFAVTCLALAAVALLAAGLARRATSDASHQR